MADPRRVNWLLVRQQIFFHSVLQANKTIRTGQPRPLYNSISTDHPRNTRSAAQGLIRFGETFSARTTFKYRALHWYNSVPASVKEGSQAIVKRKPKSWIK